MDTIKSYIENVIVKPGGRLFRCDWVYDELKDEGQHEEEDVTDEAPAFLFYPACKVDNGVTLHDIFLLIERNLDLYKAIFNTWVDEIVVEGLAPYQGNDTANDIEYVEVYWSIGYWDSDSELSGMLMPCFHGIGYAEEDGSPRTNYGLGFAPASLCADKPFRIGEAWLYDDETPSLDRQKRYASAEMSLAQILYAVVWELSFNGSPQERDEKSKKLEQRFQDYKSQKETNG